MTILGPIALLLAAGAAGYLIWLSAAQKDEPNHRSTTIFKIVAWLGLAGALFAANLFPFAFMILLAAGGVAGIEIWRERAMKDLDDQTSDYSALGGDAQPIEASGRISKKEAASLLGVSDGVSEDEIKAAHKKLIAQLHPDKGGTDYLAAKINEARDVLLGEKVAVGDSE